MPILTVARLTFREAARRRLLLAVVLLTVVVVVLTGWGVSRIATLMRNGQPISHTQVIATTSGLVILLAFMFSFVLAVGAAFLAAPAVAADVESGLVLALLPRPIRRSQFVLGKWLGLAVLMSGYTAVASTLQLATIDALTGYVPPHPVVAVLFLIGQTIVLLTLALLGSTRLSPITGGIIALVLFGIAWIVGNVTAIGAAFNNNTLLTFGTVVNLILPTDGLWRGAIFNLEPAALIAVGAAANNSPFGAIAPPTGAFVAWAVGWIVAVLGLAAFSFRRRDL